MGTAHINLHPIALGILKERHADEVIIRRVIDFGDGTLYVEVESNLLKEGYRGFLELYFKDEQVFFKRDQDT